MATSSVKLPAGFVLDEQPQAPKVPAGFVLDETPKEGWWTARGKQLVGEVKNFAAGVKQVGQEAVNLPSDVLSSVDEISRGTPVEDTRLGEMGRQFVEGAKRVPEQAARMPVAAAERVTAWGNPKKLIEESPLAAVLDLIAAGAPAVKIAEAAAPVIKAGALDAAAVAADVAPRVARGAASLPVRGAKSVAEGLTDFFAGVKSGTSRTLGRVGTAPEINEQAVQELGQSISDAVSAHKRVVGAKINGAFETLDAAHPEGAVPVADVRRMVDNFANEVGADKALKGKAGVIAPVIKQIRESVGKWIDENTTPLAGNKGVIMNRKLTTKELKNVIDELQDNVNFQGMAIGDKSAVKARILKLTEQLSNRLAEVNPAAARALRDYATLIGDSNAITDVFGIVGGQTVGPAEVIQFADRLEKFIKQRSVSDETVSNVVRRVGGKDLLTQSQQTAVAQQLAGEVQQAVSPLSFWLTSLRRMTAGPTRAVAPGAVKAITRLSDAVDSILGVTRPGAAKVRELTAPAVDALKSVRNPDDLLEVSGELLFAVVSATTEKMTPVQARVATEKLRQELAKRGYTPTRGAGMGPAQVKTEDVFFIPGMDDATAKELGDKFSQQYVLTKNGMLDVATGNVTPAVPNSVSAGTPEMFKGQYHTVLHKGKNRIAFKVDFPQ